jgi:hypothetical protein
VVAEVVVASVGLVFLVASFRADRFWVDRHFMPAFYPPHRVYVVAASVGRVLAGALGLALALVARSRIGRFVARVPARSLVANLARVSLAVVLALGASEWVLRRTVSRATEERPADEEPLRHPDQKLGWTFVPGHTGHATVNGRVIEYAFDSAGYRVRRADEAVEPQRPTIVFAGESFIVGHGLTWDESVPGQVEALLGTQTANLAVHGFANDQAYMRLLAELPRFRQPVAVLSLFMPALFDRNLDDDRPHLGPELGWRPAERRWRLTALAKRLAPYRSDEVIEGGIVTTRALLQATVDLAKSRGAIPLIVVPQFAPEDPIERMLRQRILDEPGLPYVWVELDPGWRMPGDGHPDARGAHAIAAAIASRLQRR